MRRAESEIVPEKFIKKIIIIILGPKLKVLSNSKKKVGTGTRGSLENLEPNNICYYILNFKRSHFDWPSPIF
jgi:hypothetical protein